MKLRGCTFECYNKKANRYLPTEGYFHKWGTQGLEGDDNSVAENTMAIVEEKNGQVHEVSPSKIKFTDFVF